MGKIILVTGGCRSGKSQFALQLAEAAGDSRLYLATAPVLDPEMEERIARHRAERATRHWETCEEQLNLVQALQNNPAYQVVLCDCLTLWINNQMYQAEQKGKLLKEEAVALAARQVLEEARNHPGTVVFVTNEVGLGIVPGDALSRRFRDLAGRCNQVMAAAADEVYFMVSGIPQKIKGKK
jgi:adenosylcobinamide kinase / adenosylcobinamide-phosphate guanylyltransferase